MNLTGMLSAKCLIKLTDINGKDFKYQTRYVDRLSKADQLKAKDASKFAVKELVKALKQKNYSERVDQFKKHLDPITVIADTGNAGKFLIVSGFHRFKAYGVHNKEVGDKRLVKSSIAAQVWLDSEEDALKYSAGMDVKTLYSKTSKMKFNAAWDEVYKLGHSATGMFSRELSQAEIAGRLMVSRSTVQRMTEVALRIHRGADGLQYYPNWQTQRLMAAGFINDEKQDEEMMKAKRVNKLRKAIAKALEEVGFTSLDEQSVALTKASVLVQEAIEAEQVKLEEKQAKGMEEDNF